MSAVTKVFGANGTVGRETPGEVVFVPRLRGALEELNPKLPPEASPPGISVFRPVSRTGEIADWDENHCQTTGRRSGHVFGHCFGLFFRND